MRILIIFLIGWMFIFVGCSGGGNPTTPDGQSKVSSNTPGSIDNLPIIGLTANDDGSFNALGLMGAYELRLNPVSTSAELVSKRFPSSLGQSWIVNGKTFFSISPCTTCLKIKSVALKTDNSLTLTFGISHPFQPGDPLKPITGRNRLDLDIFDVALVVRPLETTPATYPLLGTSAYSGILLNNAGYTVELKNVIDDPAAMPYALVIDDSTGSTSTFNEFPMGMTSTFTVDFDLSTTAYLNFDLYLTMGYGASTKNKSQRFTPTYFNPEFNRKPAWKVQVTPPEGTNPPATGNTWDSNDSTTPYPVTVKVWDWQHGVTTIVNPPVNPEDIAFASNVTGVSVEVPGMNTTLQSSTTPTSGTGTPSDPLIYTISFPNQNKLDVGEYTGLVKVTDSRMPGLIPPDGDIDYVIDVKVGGVLENKAIPEFATYQTFVATVVAGNLPPTCDLVLSKYSVLNGEIFNADPGTSADPEGLIQTYEYDKDYDGTTFIADITQTRGNPDFGAPVPIFFCNSTANPITETIALRVCDGGGPPGLCSPICTKDVTIASGKLGKPADLKVASINRGESIPNQYLITSITLDWPDVGCTVEYAIERSNGYTGTGWTVVGTSTTSSYKYVLSGNDWDNDFRFHVIARAVAGGDPLTDSDPSKEVFVLFISDMGYTITENRFYQYHESYTVWPSDFWGPNVDGWPATSPCAMSLICSTNPVPNQWGLYRSQKPIPDLVGETEAWWDGFVAKTSNGGATWTSTIGVVVGSIINPNPFSSTVSDFVPGNAILNSSYWAYNQSNTGVISEFNTSSDQMAWNNPGSGWTHVGYYVNELCDGPGGTRNYLSFGIANSNQYPTDLLWFIIDASVFVVQ